MALTKGAGVTDDLAFLSAVEALAQFRSRTLSPVKLLDALVARRRRRPRHQRL